MPWQSEMTGPPDYQDNRPSQSTLPWLVAAQYLVGCRWKRLAASAVTRQPINRA
jgi:hypothetical protein